MSLTTSAVIVTFNGWPLLRPCLDSLSRQERPPDEVVVVDNGSTDGTAELVRDAFPAVRLVELPSNVGFAAGANRGIERAAGDVLVLLNNDVIAEPAVIAELAAPLECDAALGVIGGTMVFANEPSIVASAGIEVFANGLILDRALGTERASLTSSVEVFGASAGAAAYRRAALDDVGGFAEPFFMYLEDGDLAWRLQLRGWTARHAPGAVVRHRYSASAVEGSSRKRRLLARNRLWLIARCLPSELLWPNLHRVLTYELLALSYGVARFDRASLAGRLDGLAGLPRRMRERHDIQQRATVPAASLARWLKRPPPPAELLRLRRLTAALAEPGAERG